MNPSHDDQFEGPWWRYPVLRNALVAGALAGLGFGLATAGAISARVETILYVMAIPLGGYHWGREALEDLFREREIGIDLLMLLAAVGSAVLGLWGEAAFLVFLYGAAEGLEEYAYARTRGAIRALLDLAPKEARVLKPSGEEVTVPAETLRPGDRFAIRPGESVPTDGLIRRGSTSLDESSVTGESIPVDKGPGMQVFAGTVNQSGALEIEATVAFQDNTLSKIIQLVERAHERKGQTQQWIERFGRRYSPAVLIAATALFVIPWLAGFPATPWFIRAIVVLVAAAPCALVMSTPVAIAAGIGAAGRRGILIKGGAHLEQLGRVAAVAFDKTGTLTEGRPLVVNIVSPNRSADEVLACAAAIEQLSEHPLARAVVEEARHRDLTMPAVTDFRAMTGAGARAQINGTTWFVGSPRLFDDLSIDVGPVRATIEQFEADAKTVVLLGTRDAVSGILTLEDRIRPEAPRIVSALHAMGIHATLLTGDNQRTAEAVATRVGIKEVHAGLRPDGKVAVVEALKQRFPAGVLMVGDGLNDAPALAAATCGVVMGVAGSDAAIEAADVALMADDLLKVEEAIALGKRSRHISTQNIIFSIVILLVLVPAAVLGLIGIAVSVVTHELSELLAVANGLRVAVSPVADVQASRREVST